MTLAEWRAQVEKDLAGVPFDKALVHRTAEGLAIQPLYVEAPAGRAGGLTVPAHHFRLCMPHAGAGAPPLQEDLEGGAEALWIQAGTGELESILRQVQTVVADPILVVEARTGDGGAAPLAELSTTLAPLLASASRRASPGGAIRLALAADPIGTVASGRLTPDRLADEMAALGPLGRRLHDSGPGTCGTLVSTLRYHAAGADAAEEIALALSTGVAYLEALLQAGLDAEAAARQVAVQVAVGRDTFVELCKLRALRTCWHKLLAAAGATRSPLPLLHAVSSSRTLTEQDPWVNMLRATTQVFAAVLGGADLITPAAFDEALGPASELGRRVARNTALVLREESHLGRVVDPGGGSYYFETLTDALAREAWQRFRTLEQDGGVARALTSGALATRLDAAWAKRRELIVKRREPITGVSEYANLDEPTLPRTPTAAPAAPPALPLRRDAEPFERLRDRAEQLAAQGAAIDVALVTLGPPAEHRARVGFSTGFFAAGGLRTRETADPAAAASAAVACLCGADERYASEAAERAQALKAAGCRRMLLAGRPGALEPALRAAGVDGFIFLGCDVVATLAGILGVEP